MHQSPWLDWNSYGSTWEIPVLGYSTPTTNTILTTDTKTSSGCNLGSMHHKRLILVSNYMFMAIISLLKKLFLLSCVYKHQKQYNQQVPELSQGVNICHIS